MVLGPRQAFSTCHSHIRGGIILCCGGWPLPSKCLKSPFPAGTSKSVSRCPRCPMSPGSKTTPRPGLGTTGPRQLLTTDVPSSRGTAAGTAPPAACRSDSAGDRGKGGLSAIPPHGDRQHGTSTHIHTAPTTKAWAWPAHQRNEGRGSTVTAFSCLFCRGGNRGSRK